MTGSATTIPADARRLTSPHLISLDYHPPSAALAPYVTTFYLFRCEEAEVRDMQPAALGHIYVFLRGEGSMVFGGREDRGHPVSLMAPATAAAPINLDGPFHLFGAALSPLGWASFTGLSAAEHHDRMDDAVPYLGPEIASVGTRMRQAYDGDPDAALPRFAGWLSEFLLPRIKHPPARHAALIAAVVQWLGSALDPPLERLHERLGYSPRQAQRLVQHYFGMPPKQLIRKYRALRAATILGDAQAPQELVDAAIDSFYDQSHMIREIRLFAGRTPARIGDPDNPYLNLLLDKQNYTEFSAHAPLDDEG